MERGKRGRKEEKWKESWNRAADWLRPALGALPVTLRHRSTVYTAGCHPSSSKFVNPLEKFSDGLNLYFVL